MKEILTTKKSFTLMEIVTVVVIIGVMAAFAIPNYSASVERAHRRDATNNLMAIHTANSIFLAENGETWPPSTTWENIAAINTNLGLSIIGNGMEYRCRNPNQLLPNLYTCVACRPDCTKNDFTLTITQAPIVNGTNPSCSGSCP